MPHEGSRPLLVAHAQSPEMIPAKRIKLMTTFTSSNLGHNTSNNLSNCSVLAISGR